MGNNIHFLRFLIVVLTIGMASCSLGPFDPESTPGDNATGEVRVQLKGVAGYFAELSERKIVALNNERHASAQAIGVINEADFAVLGSNGNEIANWTTTYEPDSLAPGSFSNSYVSPGTDYVLKVDVYNSDVSLSEPVVSGQSSPFTVSAGDTEVVQVNCFPNHPNNLAIDEKKSQSGIPAKLSVKAFDRTPSGFGYEEWYTFSISDTGPEYVEISAVPSTNDTYNTSVFIVVYDYQGNIVVQAVSPKVMEPSIDSAAGVTIKTTQNDPGTPENEGKYYFVVLPITLSQDASSNIEVSWTESDDIDEDRDGDGYDNDEIAYAENISKDTLIQGTCVSSDPGDYYRFDLTDTADVKIDIELLHGFAMDFRLSDASENYIEDIGLATYSGTAQRGIVSRDLPPGTYYIFLGGYGEAYELSWTTTTTMDDDYEENDDFTSAADITSEPDTWITGTSWDADWYKITLDSQQSLKLFCSYEDEPRTNIALTLYDSNENMIDNPDIDGWYESIVEEISKDDLQSGTYYVLVEDRDGYTSPDQYQLLWTVN